MSEKPKEEFEEEEPDEIEEAAEDLDVDKLMRDFDTRKRRGARVAGEPAWRKLERIREEKRTAGPPVGFRRLRYRRDRRRSDEAAAADAGPPPLEARGRSPLRQRERPLGLATRLPSSAERSCRLSTTMCRTSPSRCSRPATPSSRAPSIAFRCASAIRLQTTRFT